MFPTEVFLIFSQEVFLTYLWNPDVETVLIALSCFGHMCDEVDVVQSAENLNEIQTSQNFQVYYELSSEAPKYRTGDHVNIIIQC